MVTDGRKGVSEGLLEFTPHSYSSPAHELGMYPYQEKFKFGERNAIGVNTIDSEGLLFPEDEYDPYANTSSHDSMVFSTTSENDNDNDNDNCGECEPTTATATASSYVISEEAYLPKISSTSISPHFTDHQTNYENSTSASCVSCLTGTGTGSSDESAGQILANLNQRQLMLPVFASQLDQEQLLNTPANSPIPISEEEEEVEFSSEESAAVEALKSMSLRRTTPLRGKLLLEKAEPANTKKGRKGGKKKETASFSLNADTVFSRGRSTERVQRPPLPNMHVQAEAEAEEKKKENATITGFKPTSLVFKNTLLPPLTAAPVHVSVHPYHYQVQQPNPYKPSRPISLHASAVTERILNDLNIQDKSFAFPSPVGETKVSESESKSEKVEMSMQTAVDVDADSDGDVFVQLPQKKTSSSTSNNNVRLPNPNPHQIHVQAQVQVEGGKSPSPSYLMEDSFPYISSSLSVSVTDTEVEVDMHAGSLEAEGEGNREGEGEYSSPGHTASNEIGAILGLSNNNHNYCNQSDSFDPNDSNPRAGPITVPGPVMYPPGLGIGPGEKWGVLGVSPASIRTPGQSIPSVGTSMGVGIGIDEKYQVLGVSPASLPSALAKTQCKQLEGGINMNMNMNKGTQRLHQSHFTPRACQPSREPHLASYRGRNAMRTFSPGKSTIRGINSGFETISPLYPPTGPTMDPPTGPTMDTPASASASVSASASCQENQDNHEYTTTLSDVSDMSDLSPADLRIPPVPNVQSNVSNTSNSSNDKQHSYAVAQAQVAAQAQEYVYERPVPLPVEQVFEEEFSFSTMYEPSEYTIQRQRTPSFEFQYAEAEVGSKRINPAL